MTQVAAREQTAEPGEITPINHWIGGKRVAGRSGRSGPVYNPATGQQTGAVDFASVDEVNLAVRTAKEAFPAWRATSLSKRTEILFEIRRIFDERRKDIAKFLTREHGKVLSDALGEVARGIEIVDFACGIPTLLKGGFTEQASTGIDVYSIRQPVGVVAGITPFNFPAMVPMWMFAPALACGNVFVLKPSEKDPSASLYVAELLKEAGVPDGVFNVVHGDKVAVDALLEHPDIAAVSFVGSTPIARYVYETATANGKRVQALGGAKNHAVVMPDANLDFAANHLTAAGFGSAGQRCTAISVALASRDGPQPLIERLVQKAREVKVGRGLDPESEMGPVITAQARDRITGYIEAGEQTGAEIVVDGREIDREGDGFWVGPTLIDRVTTDMTVYTDEIFGPVLCVVRLPTLDAAIELINDNAYANGAAIFTGSGQAARTFQRKVEVGMIGVNVPIPVPMAFYSFGGWKDSLFGDHHMHGPEGIRFYTRGKAGPVRWPEEAQDAS